MQPSRILSRSGSSLRFRSGCCLHYSKSSPCLVGQGSLDFGTVFLATIRNNVLPSRRDVPGLGHGRLQKQRCGFRLRKNRRVVGSKSKTCTRKWACQPPLHLVMGDSLAMHFQDVCGPLPRWTDWDWREAWIVNVQPSCQLGMWPGTT